MVASGHGVGEGGFPGAGAGCRVDDNRMTCLEYRLQTGKYLQSEGSKFRSPMINRGQTDCSQNPFRHRARTWNLQEVSAGSMEIEIQHRRSSRMMLNGLIPSVADVAKASTTIDGSRKTDNLDCVYA